MRHEMRKERANSTAAANNHLNPPSGNDEDKSRAPAAVKESSQKIGDENVEGQGHFGLATCRQSSPPRTYNHHLLQRTPAAFDQYAALEPPVTKKTLSELDVNKIVHNPKLRHDINFDPDLHFRPNLDGEKGKIKAEKQDAFYELMRTQLCHFLTNREDFNNQYGNADWCLPATLKAIRGILETLVPQRDRPSVEETFNVDLLMQQFCKGVADLPKLAQWLSQLLKCHCAPMRDTWVDEMVIQISMGDQEGDVAKLVLGMRNLLGVLEAMKLDVANHQIRCLRPLLIEDTIHFEQKFFMRKIALDKVNVGQAHAWFRNARGLPDIVFVAQSKDNFWDFMKALVDLILQPTNTPHPDTFIWDTERLHKLHADIEDMIKLEICMQLFRRLQADSRRQAARRMACDDTPVTSTVASPSTRPASPADNTIPSPPDPVLPSPYDFLSIHASGHHHRFSHLEDDAVTSSFPSPRSSPLSLASTPDYAPSPLCLSMPSVDTSPHVRSSLQAILSSSNSPDRWRILAPALALQILHSTTANLTRLPQVEFELASYLSNTGSGPYRDAERKVLVQLYPMLRKLVDSYTPLTCPQMFEAATGQKSTTVSSTKAGGVKEEIEDVATRIAHIGVLHWRVWAPLAYLVDPDADLEEPTFVRAKSEP